MSIEISELRFGNWVRRTAPYNDQGWISNVGSTVLVHHPKGGTHHYLSQLMPIVLTPEILEKCGFERERPDDRYGQVYIKKRTVFIFRKVNFGVFPKDDFGWAFELSDKENWATVVSKVEWLHQLQNLWYSLTGEELTYTP